MLRAMDDSQPVASRKGVVMVRKARPMVPAGPVQHPAAPRSRRTPCTAIEQFRYASRTVDRPSRKSCCRHRDHEPLERREGSRVLQVLPGCGVEELADLLVCFSSRASEKSSYDRATECRRMSGRDGLAEKSYAPRFTLR